MTFARLAASTRHPSDECQLSVQGPRQFVDASAIDTSNYCKLWTCSDRTLAGDSAARDRPILERHHRSPTMSTPHPDPYTFEGSDGGPRDRRAGQRRAEPAWPVRGPLRPQRTRKDAPPRPRGLRSGAGRGTGEPSQRGPSEGLFGRNGRARMRASSTTRPSIRCPWMIRSRTAGSHARYHVPSG